MGILAVGAFEHLICIAALSAVSFLTSEGWPVMEGVVSFVLCMMIYVCVHLLIESFRKGKKDELKEIDSNDGSSGSNVQSRVG